ncbi:MAG: hypothetical protein OEX19_14145 [Gammaproteobacteria bacterium]|nr:hypothetical protein [Gammaproteobacteria bacterium]
MSSLIVVSPVIIVVTIKIPLKLKWKYWSSLNLTNYNSMTYPAVVRDLCQQTYIWQIDENSYEPTLEKYKRQTA